MLIHSLAHWQHYYTSGILAQIVTGTPTAEHHPSSPGHPLETPHTRYL